MPTNTFRRLPAAKKRRLLHAAWAEFSQYSYADSSINRIVFAADIPRGSFYQYFINKEDLFLYLLEVIEHNTRKSLSHMLQICQNDLSCALVLLFDNWFLQHSAPTFSEFQMYNLLKRNPMLDWQLRLSGRDYPPLSGGRQISHRSVPQMSEEQQVLLLCFFANICKRTFFYPEDTLRFRQELIHTTGILSQPNTITQSSALDESGTVLRN